MVAEGSDSTRTEISRVECDVERARGRYNPSMFGEVAMIVRVERNR